MEDKLGKIPDFCKMREKKGGYSSVYERYDTKARTSMGGKITVGRESKTMTINILQAVSGFTGDRTPQFDWYMSCACYMDRILWQIYCDESDEENLYVVIQSSHAIR